MPKDIGGGCQLRIRHRVINTGTEPYSLLRSRVGHPPTVVRRIHPPHDGKEKCPARREHVINEKQVCEIERLFCVFLEKKKTSGK